MGDRPDRADRRPSRTNVSDDDVSESLLPDVDETLIEDSELDERIEDWKEQHRAGTLGVKGTLYKHESVDPKSPKEQVDFYSGTIPLRHDIGLEYGGGRYMLILSTGGGKNERKTTSFRFILHKSYDEKSRKYHEEKTKREREALSQSMSPVPAPSLPAISQADSLKESLALVQGMFAQFMTMIQPVMTRAMQPPRSETEGIKGEITMFGELRTLLRSMTKNDIAFFNQMKGSFMNPTTDTAEFSELDEDGNPVKTPEDNKFLGVFERIVKIAEPFIPLLAQNSIAAKTAAAGIRAYPEVKQVIQQVQQNPAFVSKVVEYVKAKEGINGARNVLINLGLNADKFIPRQIPAPPQAGKKVALPAKRKLIVRKK
jgi:hypothetical protein